MKMNAEKQIFSQNSYNRIAIRYVTKIPKNPAQNQRKLNEITSNQKSTIYSTLVRIFFIKDVDQIVQNVQ